MILFIDNELSSDESELMNEHIKSCNKCRELYQSIKLAYSFIEEDRKEKVNPFLYTAINQKIINLQNKDINISQRRGYYLPYKPLYLAIIFVFAVFIGINLGNKIYHYSDFNLNNDNSLKTEKVKTVSTIYSSDIDDVLID